ncbi:MAG: farnesyl diphosphate synthase [Wenzhouxiangella sp.]
MIDTDRLIERVESVLKRHLEQRAELSDERLLEAMAYAVFNGGKRLRPLLVYASGTALGLSESQLDAPACAVELIHCYSLVHDDLPAMDDDDLRRGRPTAHLAFDEATAILAGDALQALAFQVLAEQTHSDAERVARLAMVGELARACGAAGMAGGQMQDLAMEHQQPSQAAVETMFKLKTGELILAAVTMPAALLPELPAAQRAALNEFGERIGLAFQIRDDLLDVEGETEVIGKKAGADLELGKASWPTLFGIEAAHERIRELDAQARAALNRIDGDMSPLHALADILLHRQT